MDFEVRQGDRLALNGPNGSGKSTLLKLLMGELSPTEGGIWRAATLQVSTLPQDTGFLQGDLKLFAAGQGVDERLFFALLRKLDFEREAFERPMQSFSAGQKKKVCLAASLAKPAQLFIWDEPLNYVDVLSREQIEQAVLGSAPTLIFVEHDAVFTGRVATGETKL